MNRKEIRKYMINKLIRGKIIKKFLVRDKYYHIIIDGTGLATSRKKYNENCLVKNKTNKFKIKRDKPNIETYAYLRIHNKSRGT